MPIKRSPGCGCCGATCEELTTGFTLLPNRDVQVTSVQEWHLVTDQTYTAAQLNSKYRDGSLSAGEAWVTKSPILPSVDNWYAFFDMGVTDEPGAKYRLLSLMTLNTDNTPKDYIFVEVDNLQPADEPEESNFAFSTSRKITLGQVVGGVTTIFSVDYTEATARSFCRRPEIDNATFLGAVDMNESPTLATIPVVDTYRPAFVITGGDGGIPETGQAGAASLAVEDGDVIICLDFAQRSLVGSWSVIKPPIPATSVLTAGTAVESPAITVDGGHVGLQVLAGGGSSLTEVQTRYNRWLDRPQCDSCGVAIACPCAGDSEHPVFAEATSNASLEFHGEQVRFAIGLSNPNDFTYSQDIGDWSVLRQSTCRFSFVRLGLMTGPCVQQSRFNNTQFATNQQFWLVYELVSIVIQSLPGLRVEAQIGGEFGVIYRQRQQGLGGGGIGGGGVGQSAVPFSYFSGWQSSQPPCPSVSDLLDLTYLTSSADPDRYWTWPFGNNSLAGVRQTGWASGSESVIIDADTMDCADFTIQGTYASQQDINGSPHAADGQTWTIQSV